MAGRLWGTVSMGRARGLLLKMMTFLHGFRLWLSLVRVRAMCLSMGRVMISCMLVGCWGMRMRHGLLVLGILVQPCPGQLCAHRATERCKGLVGTPLKLLWLRLRRHC